MGTLRTVTPILMRKRQRAIGHRDRDGNWNGEATAKETRSHQKLQTVMSRLPLELLEGTIDSSQISVLHECHMSSLFRHVITAAREARIVESELHLPTQPSGHYRKCPWDL